MPKVGLEPGWLARQFAAHRREVATWPEWMRRAMRGNMDAKEIAVTAGSGCVWCDLDVRHQAPCGVIERLQRHILSVEASLSKKLWWSYMDQITDALGIERGTSINGIVVQATELIRQRDEALEGEAEAKDRETLYREEISGARSAWQQHHDEIVAALTARVEAAERERDEAEDQIFEIQNVLEDARFIGGTTVSDVKRLVASVEASTRKTDEMGESMVPEVDHRG